MYVYAIIVTACIILLNHSIAILSKKIEIGAVTKI